MKLHDTADRQSYKRMNTSELRERFLLEDVFQSGELTLTYTDVDRAVICGAVPLDQPLSLPTHKELAAEYFCERRELGVINIGGAGHIVVDGETYAMNNRDSLYIARESVDVEFASKSADEPAQFYMASYPAHRTTQTVHVPKSAAKKLEMGSQTESNTRVIYQSIRPGIVDSCQLVMGFTELASGNVWNTKPPHTHKRRTEIYMYFDLDEDSRVFHFMGEPQETRSLVMKNGHVALSPSWSIHSGVGTSNYTFIWSMGGENQEFDDMDHLTFADIS